jgi:hypothetical protein
MTDPEPPSPLEPEPTSAPVPTRRIVTVRNERALRWGWAAVGIGIILVAIGALIGFGSQAIQVAAAKGRAQVGNPVTFDADGGTTYAITLIPEPTTGDFVEDRIAQLDCTAKHPGGDTEVLDVSSAAVRTSNSVGVFATDFKGRGGSTTILCDWGGPSDLGGFYAVAKTHKATRYVGTGMLVGGIAIGLLGVGLLVNGYKGRPELQAIGTDGTSV